MFRYVLIGLILKMFIFSYKGCINKYLSREGGREIERKGVGRLVG